MNISGNQTAIQMGRKPDASPARKGVTAGLLSGCVWGINSVALVMALRLVPAMDQEVTIYAVPLAAACINDTLAGLWLLLYNSWAGRAQKIIRSLKTFAGFMLCMAALLGGPLANGGYLLGLSMAGPAYTLTITALYPLVGAVLSRIFLRQEIVPRVWMGMFFSVIGAIIISYAPPEGQNISTFYLGMLCASVAALGWGAEAVLAGFSMSAIEPEVAVNLRELVSGTVMGIFVLPIIGGWAVISQICTLPGTLGAFAIVAFGASISYLSWYRSNSFVGVAKGTALNGTYVAWGVVFSVVFMGQPLTPNLAIGSSLVLVGAMLVTINPRGLFRRSGN